MAFGYIYFEIFNEGIRVDAANSIIEKLFSGVISVFLVRCTAAFIFFDTGAFLPGV